VPGYVTGLTIGEGGDHRGVTEAQRHPPGAKALTEKKGFIAALEALRHPKTTISAL